MSNTGKSLLLASLTNAVPEIADYPFTTKSPNIGMMPFENIQIQIIDMPAVNMAESRIWTNNILRNADLLALVVDLTADPAQQIYSILSELKKMGIVPAQRGQNAAAGGLRERKTFIIGNMSDIDLVGEGIRALAHEFKGRLDSISVSAADKLNLEMLKRQLFAHIDIIRVHTKSPGTRVDLNNPVILKKDATVREAAAAVHKDFASRLRYSVVWGSGKFEGQRVGPEHVLHDNDIIELHISG